MVDLKSSFLVTGELTTKTEFESVLCYKDLSIKIQLPKNITAPELSHSLKKTLKWCRVCDIDIQSFRELGLDISQESISYVFYSLLSFQKIPFSFKKKEENKYNIINEKESVQEIKNICESEAFVRGLQETPSNLLGPEEFIKESEKFLKDTNVKFVTLDAKELKQKKMNLLCAVGGEGARVLIVTHNGGEDSAYTALVGKGITFDTGGLNLKPGNHMRNMKFDMSGGAITLGVLKTLSQNKAPVNVFGVIGLAENLVFETAYKPDDVFVSYSGLSVEIDNTDAEGRLLLADLIHYAKKDLKATKIITIATLTGAMGYALGDKYAGIWSSSDKEWELLNKASMCVGEFVWRMPLDQYFLKPLLNSRVADLKNSASGLGGSCRAASFLYKFSQDVTFLHCDIANVAHGERDDISRAPLLKTLYKYLVAIR